MELKTRFRYLVIFLVYSVARLVILQITTVYNARKLFVFTVILDSFRRLSYFMWRRPVVGVLLYHKKTFLLHCA